MSDEDLAMLTAEFERLVRECDTPAKATAQLQREGLLDEDGQLAPMYRDDLDEVVCR